MNKLGTENSKIMTNKIEVYFCHKVKLRRSSSRACMYMPMQGVKFLFPDDILCMASIPHISSCLKILLEIQSFCPIPVQKKGKRRAKHFKDFFSEKRERRVKRDNKPVFTSGGLMLSQKLDVSVLWKMGERSPQQFQNN